MNKFLVPVDGSAASKKAAEKAIETAKMQNAELTFIYVVNEPDLYNHTSYGIHIQDLQILKESGEKAGKLFIDRFVESLNTENVVINKLVVTGQPYEEIINVAENDNFDLIIMGRRGYSKIKRFFVGSVTHRVIAGSPCPVLIVME